MGKKQSIIVDSKDLESKVKSDLNASNCKIFKTQNVYLSSFLISQDNFKLGRVYIEDLNSSNRANIEIEYDPKYQTLLDNYIETYRSNKAIVNLYVYQQSIRFIMHLINKRKSGLED